MNTSAATNLRLGPEHPDGGTVRPFKLAPLLAVALAAAVAAYALHHLPWLADHGLALAPLTVVVAMCAGLAVARVVRPAPTTPLVLVAQPGAVEVRPARPAELDLLMAVHREALGHGFLTQLGPGFLRAYEGTFADSPHAVALVATLSGTPVGALTGVLRPPAHARWTLRHRGVRLAAHAAGGLLVRPKMAAHFVRTRLSRYAGAWRRHRSPEAAPPPTGSVAVLSHVAVLPGARGSGAGRRLVDSFVEMVAAEGIDTVMLETRRGESGAGSFYEKAGWQRAPAGEHSGSGVMETWTHDAHRPDA